MTRLVLNNLTNFNVYAQGKPETWAMLAAFSCWIILACCAVLLARFVYLEWSGSLGPYRTLINRLTAFNNTLIILFVVLVYSPELVRTLKGPLPPWLCHFSYLARMSLVNMFSLTTMSITIAKFVIVRVWKKVPVMDDRLIAFVIAACASLLGVLTALTKSYLPGRPVFLQINCVGVYHEMWSDLPKKFQLENIFFAVPLLVHFVLALAVAKYKKEMQSLDNPPMAANNPKTMENFFISGVILLSFFVANVMVAKLNAIDPSQWEAYPGYINVIAYQHILPTVSLVSLTALQVKSIKDGFLIKLLRVNAKCFPIQQGMNNA